MQSVPKVTRERPPGACAHARAPTQCTHRRTNKRNIVGHPPPSCVYARLDHAQKIIRIDYRYTATKIAPLLAYCAAMRGKAHLIKTIEQHHYLYLYLRNSLGGKWTTTKIAGGMRILCGHARKGTLEKSFLLHIICILLKHYITEPYKMQQKQPKTRIK